MLSTHVSINQSCITSSHLKNMMSHQKSDSANQCIFTGQCCLRSTTSRAAIVQRMRTQLGHWAFSVRGPTIWNSSPKTMRLTDNYQQFRQLL